MKINLTLCYVILQQNKVKQKRFNFILNIRENIINIYFILCEITKIG